MVLADEYLEKYVHSIELISEILSKDEDTGALGELLSNNIRCVRERLPQKEVVVHYDFVKFWDEEGNRISSVEAEKRIGKFLDKAIFGGFYDD